MDENQIRYAIARQVPEMERGFTVATNYGDIVIPAGKLASQMRGHMERALARELARLLVSKKAVAAFPPISQAQAVKICNDFVEGGRA
ncbi:MAG: hypothetical protein ACTS8S_00110 [Giesbergeria sp.]